MHPIGNIISQSELKKDNDLLKYRDKILVENLISKKIAALNSLSEVVENSGNDNVDTSDLIQQYYRLRKSSAYRLLILPLTSEEYSGKVAIQSLFQPHFNLRKVSSDDEIIKVYESYVSNYESYLNIIDKFDNELANNYFKPLAKNLFASFKTKSKIKEGRNANLVVSLQERRYNLADRINDDIRIFLEVKNIGDGVALNLNFDVKENEFIKGKGLYELGVLPVNDARQFSIDAEFLNSQAYESLIIEVETRWNNTNGEKNIIVNSLEMQAQDTNVNWDDLVNNAHIYSKRKIRKEEKLFGRDNILDRLVRNAKADHIESFKLWGQKRVGKSSIALTFQSLLAEDDEIIVTYSEILPNVSAIESLNDLGEALCREIKSEIRKSKNVNKKELLRVEFLDFNGSFKPLDYYIKDLRDIDERLKFILILDEFDRLNDNFFVPGSFAETFSLSIGKKINGYDFVGFVLIGSENIGLLNYQEINYNSFNDEKIDSFDIVQQYEDYRDIIISPVRGIFNYSDASIEAIHKITNGNPYFTNVICKEIYNYCVKTRESDIQVDKVEIAKDVLVRSESKSAFAHFWEDGLTNESKERRNRTSDIRRRILVAFSNYYRDTNKYPTNNQLLQRFKYPEDYTIDISEVQGMINNFFSRSIFSKADDLSIRIVPYLFEEWLCKGNGGRLIIEGVADLESQMQQLEYDKTQLVRSDEISKTISKIPYKGNELGEKRVKDFLSQLGPHTDQRKVYELLDNFVYIDNSEIADFLRKNQVKIFGPIDIELDKSVRTFRRKGIETFSMQPFFDQNILYFKTFKTISSLNPARVLSSTLKDSSKWKSKDCNTVVILESVSLNLDLVYDELVAFLRAIKNHENEIAVRYLTFVLTKKVKFAIEQIVVDLDILDFDIIALHEVESGEVLPFSDNSILIESSLRRSQIYSFCKSLNNNTSQDDCLVLFEKFCPIQTVPVFWSSLNQINPLFPNKFDLRESYIDKSNLQIEATGNGNTGSEELEILDRKIEKIEIWMRKLIIDKIGEVRKLKKMSDLTNRDFILDGIERKINNYMKKYPASDKEQMEKPEHALEFSDLSNLQYIICSTSKGNYRHFEKIFGDKKNFQLRFGQLLEFRNIKRHIRRTVIRGRKEIDPIAINDVKAGIEWFERIINNL
ncbi:MAG: ATP-binding protein [Bacteroidota bacterium]